MTAMSKKQALKFVEPPVLRANVRIRVRDRNRQVIHEHKGHNIYVNHGREWLCELMSYSSYPVAVGAAPPAVNHSRLIGFMGLGVGGQEQITDPGDAFFTAQYCVVHAGDGVPNPIPGFYQDDTDVTGTGLEYPLLWTVGKYGKPIEVVDYSVPVGAPPFRVWVKYTATWRATDINTPYGGLTVPISEAALYPILLSGSNVKEMTFLDMRSECIAYEAFSPINKQGVFEVEVQWTLKA